MEMALNLTKEEAFALLELALASATEEDEVGERALRKLVEICKRYLSEEVAAGLSA